VGARVSPWLTNRVPTHADYPAWNAPVSFTFRKADNRWQIVGLDRTVGTQLPGIDFVALAEGQGVRGVRVETAEALDGALSASLASFQPNLVEVVVD